MISSGSPLSLEKNKKITSDSDMLYLERVNYPANCFTLNLANDTDIQEKGIIDIGFILKKPENADTKERVAKSIRAFLLSYRYRYGYGCTRQIRIPLADMDNWV